jgi:IMP dehydrogenase
MQLTRNVGLSIPVVSTDTVTESHMVIALAQQGALGIIHREGDEVKRSESGMIVDPVRSHYRAAIPTTG